MEIKAETITVHSNSCLGCQHHKRDIMLSFSEGMNVHDVFPPTAQAEQIARELVQRMTQNREDATSGGEREGE